MPSLPPKLHLDADISRKAIERELTARGHDVTRTPTVWIDLDADDLTQLQSATRQGRILVTFNIADFVALSHRVDHHAGIVLAHQPDWTTSSLIGALDNLVRSTTADEWHNQVRWLNDWRGR